MLCQCMIRLILQLIKEFLPSKKIVAFIFLKSADVPVNVNKEEIEIKVLSSKSFLNCVVPYVHSGSQDSF